MKKIFKAMLIIVVILVVLYIAAGIVFNAVYNHNRTKNLQLDGNTITVTDDEYINYVEELYINPEKYLGRQIVIEGVYTQAEDEGEIYHFVGKEIEMEEHSHYDCDEAHFAEIEFLIGDYSLTVGDYIKITGTLDAVTEDDMQFLVIKDCDIQTDIPEGSKIVKQP